MQTLQKIYSSYKMYHPDGTLMCYCSEKRVNWYLKRKIAKILNDEDKSFILLFEPGGKGKANNSFYLQERRNECVCCSSKENLTRHHVVPYVFRKRMPNNIKSNNHHDILPLCSDCHEKYEEKAFEYKKLLCEKYGTDIKKKAEHDIEYAEIIKTNKRIISAKKCLQRIEKIKLTIEKEKCENLLTISNLELKEVPKNKKTTVWADDIMEKVIENNEIYEFIKNWRKHFIKYANPKNLPQNWKVDFPIEISTKNKKICK